MDHELFRCDVQVSGENERDFARFLLELFYVAGLAI